MKAELHVVKDVNFTRNLCYDVSHLIKMDVYLTNLSQLSKISKFRCVQTEIHFFFRCSEASWCRAVVVVLSWRNIEVEYTQDLL